MVRILKALVFVAWGHRHQRDKAGRRYVWHLVRVAWLAYGLTGDAEAAVAGLLHDYLEDVDPNGVGALRRWFGGETALRVFYLSRRGGQSYRDFISTVKDGGSVVVAVKIADLLHNTDPERLPVCRDDEEENKAVHRLHRYQGALAALTEQRALTGRGRQRCGVRRDEIDARLKGMK